MQTYNLPKEQVCNMRCITNLMTYNEMRHLRKPINHNKNKSLPFFDLGKPKTKSIEISNQGSVL